MTVNKISRGQPAAYGQEIIKRRFRLAQAHTGFINKIALDFGCGNGAQTVAFQGSGCKILAVDIDRSDLQTLSNYLQAGSCHMIVPVQYDGARLPVATAAVDLVFSFEVLEHVPDEATALREIHRVLKPGGEIIFSVPNKGWIFETHGAHLPILPWNRVPFFSWLPRALHSRFAKARIYRKRDIAALLRQQGFEILSIQYVTAPMDVLRNPRLKRLARALLFGSDSTRWTFLATAIFIYAVKSKEVASPRCFLPV